MVNLYWDLVSFNEDLKVRQKAVEVAQKFYDDNKKQVEIGTLVSCTLSADHRAVDGAVGAELLNAFKTLIEDPVRMLV